MLKSCKYCGRIHPRGYICPKKPKQAKHRNSKTSGFRKTHTWQKKREQIVRRDFFAGFAMREATVSSECQGWIRSCRCITLNRWKRDSTCGLMMGTF